MYYSFLIHSSAGGHLGCFHVLAILNSAAMNIGVHVSLSDQVSSVCMPRSGIAGSYGRLLDSVGEGEGGIFRENGMYIIYSETDHQPGRMLETSAQAWCTGKTLRKGVEREVGGRIRMGNTCNSMADSCQCMTKPTAML